MTYSKPSHHAEPITGHGGIDRKYTPKAQRETEQKALEAAISKHPLAWLILTARSAGKDKA